MHMAKLSEQAVKKPGHNHYIGRLAPTPSGRLHKGHAFTFAIACYRAAQHENHRVFLRIEDLDRNRCRSEYVAGIFEDLLWLGLQWHETPGLGGVHYQHEHLEYYGAILRAWARAGWVYPSDVSRKQLRNHPESAVAEAGEVIYPPALRKDYAPEQIEAEDPNEYLRWNWRWRVDYSSCVAFVDQRLGAVKYRAGIDFGDFLVWSKDGCPSYEMAVVLDDLRTGVTEVVRGEDLLLSTARQLLLYEKMEKIPPAFYHCPLVKDEHGVRLAKSFDSESIQSYRNKGYTPGDFWSELALHGYPEVAEWLVCRGPLHPKDCGPRG